MSRIKNRIQNNHGASFIEFALIFPIFAGVLFTAIQISLIFIDRASINYMTEQLLFDVATSGSIPPTLQEDWEKLLQDAQVNTTNPTIETSLCVPAGQTSLRNFASSEPTVPHDNVLLFFYVDVQLNCLINQFTFGLTDSMCRHRKYYFRLMSLDPTAYPNCDPWKTI